jgi:hypothetical protein
MTTQLLLGGGNPTRVALPIVPYEDRPRPNFLPPVEDPVLQGYRTVLDDTQSGYSEVTTVERNVPNAATKVVANNVGTEEFPWGSIRKDDEIVYEVRDEHPEAASVTSDMKRVVQVDGRHLVWQGILDFRSDRENFYYTYTRRLSENGRLIREKTWKEIIPRDYQ